eukprot:CAMPEP_0171771614 /NCGR_PEP_ID=MMETSP0991-20121206/54196_1 /TAXON_ID=483369 /ORGANISM="non described non described, Strain CCMP2098" /LENGTH=951 /DNA_ID=CAMNT_0012376981 /DNA_START=8 /DNA_END=2859 /DNA_ORIENTATION=-
MTSSARHEIDDTPALSHDFSAWCGEKSLHEWLRMTTACGYDTTILASTTAHNNLGAHGTTRTVRGIVDSGALKHIAQEGAPKENYLKVARSSMRALCASGHVVDSESKGFTKVLVPGSDPSSLGETMVFENLPGAPYCLISIPQLTKLGVRLLLDDYGDSLAITPDGVAMVLNREHPDPDGRGGHGLWYIDMEYGSVPGNATVSNRITTAPTITTTSVHTSWPSEPAHNDSADFGVFLAKSSIASMPDPAPTNLHRKRRFTILNGLPLHAALGHPPPSLYRTWRQFTHGHPLTPSGLFRPTCHGCQGRQHNRAVPRGTTAATSPIPFGTRAADEPSHVLPALGTRWACDFSRTFAVPDIWGNTCFVLFVEWNTLYLQVYLLKKHDDFWTKAAELATWCKTNLGIAINEIFCDSDPLWRNSRGGYEPDTQKAKAFSVSYNLSFVCSPPYAHPFNLAENRMGPLLGIMNCQLQYSYAAEKLWGPSVLNAKEILNVRPCPDSTRPDLQKKVPQEALLGSRPTVAVLAAAFFSLCWVKVPGSKPSDLRANGTIAMYLGVAPRSLGWLVLNPVSMAVTTTYHMLVDHNILRRPATLVAHDLLRQSSVLSAKPAAFHDSIRDLFIQDPKASRDGVIVISPLTHAPIAMRFTSEPTMGPTMVEENITTHVHDHAGAAPATTTTTVAQPSPAVQTTTTTVAQPTSAAQTTTTTVAAPHSAAKPTTTTVVPSTPLSKASKARLKSVLKANPGTIIKQCASNPKRVGSTSHTRWAAYRTATTYREFLAHGGTFANLLNDYQKCGLEIESFIPLLTIDPMVALVYLVDPPCPTLFLNVPVNPTFHLPVRLIDPFVYEVPSDMAYLLYSTQIDLTSANSDNVHTVALSVGEENPDDFNETCNIDALRAGLGLNVRGAEDTTDGRDIDALRAGLGLNVKMQKKVRFRAEIRDNDALRAGLGLNV